jgi:hypothetical protein
MRRVLVRYKLKKDRVGENEALVRAVYDELRQTSPASLRYATFKLEDGVTFAHFASLEGEGGQNPLSTLPAFKAFQKNIEDRCEEPPTPSALTEIGSYAFFPAIENVYEDRFGTIIDRPGADLLEIRWFDTTAEMVRNEFNAFLARFAGVVEARRRKFALIDSTSFVMDRKQLDPEWRDANVIPRYNAGGVQKFAFHMPLGMPDIGKDPVREPPGNFPTGYFGSRRDALAWLK